MRLLPRPSQKADLVSRSSHDVRLAVRRSVTFMLASLTSTVAVHEGAPVRPDVRSMHIKQ